MSSNTEAPQTDSGRTKERKKDRKRVFLCAFFICAAGFFAYRNSFEVPFIFDDLNEIRENRSIRSLWPPNYLRGARPVANFTFALNHAAGGLDVRGYHVVNLLIHLCAGLVLFGLVRQTLLLPSLRDRFGRNATWLAFAVAFLWTLHPLQTQSVTYLVQRHESLMGMFYLLCMYCVVRGAAAQQKRGQKNGAGQENADPEKGKGTDRPDRSQSRQSPFLCWYVAAVAACWLGMGTKQVMATAPFVILLFDRVFLSSSWKTLFRRRWGLYLGFVPAMVWLAIGLLPLFTPMFTPQSEQPAVAEAANPEEAMRRFRSVGFGVQGLSSWEYLRSQPGVILHYLRLSFWPDQLSLDYMWPVADSWVEIYAKGAVILALLSASLLALRFIPRVGFLGLSFFLILAPTSSFVPVVDLAFEHRMYLPLAALITLVVFSIYGIFRKALEPQTSRIFLGFVFLIAALSLTLRTSARNREYADQVRFWEGVIEVAPHNFFAFNNLGLELESRGKHEEAIEKFRRALEMNPEYYTARFHLARMLYRQGEVERAITEYRRALTSNPKHENSHNNLAIALARQGQFEEALPHYQAAVRLAPQNAQYHTNFGNFFARQGKFAEAVEHYERAVEADPEFIDAHVALAACYNELGEAGRAIKAARRALAIDPRHLEAARLLAWLLATSNDESLRDGVEAIRLAKLVETQVVNTNSYVLDALAAAYAEAGRFEEAKSTAQRAVRLARVAGDEAAVEEISARLELYEAGKPYRAQP